MVFGKLNLPITHEGFVKCLKEIGVDGVKCEEYFISDYESCIDGLTDNFGEYENLDELNYLASLVEELDESTTRIFVAAIEHGDYTRSVKDLINLVQNLDNYTLLEEICTPSDLGEHFFNTLPKVDIPEPYLDYFDFEMCGSDIEMIQLGSFVNGGYVEVESSRFVKFYNEEVPEEYRITTKANTNEQERKGCEMERS